MVDIDNTTRRKLWKDYCREGWCDHFTQFLAYTINVKILFVYFICVQVKVLKGCLLSAWSLLLLVAKFFMYYIPNSKWGAFHVMQLGLRFIFIWSGLGTISSNLLESFMGLYILLGQKCYVVLNWEIGILGSGLFVFFFFLRIILKIGSVVKGNSTVFGALWCMFYVQIWVVHYRSAHRVDCPVVIMQINLDQVSHEKSL